MRESVKMAADQPATNDTSIEELTHDQLLALASVSLDLGERSADRLWSRFVQMLTVNAGLVALTTVATSSDLYLVGVFAGIVGLILSFIWVRIHVVSQFNEARYRADATFTIDSSPTLRHFLRARSADGPRIPRPTGRSATHYARGVIDLILVVWGIAVLVFLFAYLDIISL